MLIASSLLVQLMRAGYEAVGDANAILDMWSWCAGDTGQDGNGGMRLQ